MTLRAGWRGVAADSGATGTDVIMLNVRFQKMHELFLNLKAFVFTSATNYLIIHQFIPAIVKFAAYAF
jgi:hypothetical protein